MYRKRFGSRPMTISLLALMPFTAGCGFLFSHAPPEDHEQLDYFTCTESNAGPIIDVIWGSLNVLAGLAAAADPEFYGEGAAVAYLSWGVLSAAAAGVGFNKSKKCKAAKRALAARQTQGRVERRDPPPADLVVQAVVLNPAADTLQVGERVQLTATAYGSGGVAIPNQLFRWSSSNDAIASVNNAGLVTGHASGTVVIAANTDNVVGTANIVVTSRR